MFDLMTQTNIILLARNVLKIHRSTFSGTPGIAQMASAASHTAPQKTHPDAEQALITSIEIEVPKSFNFPHHSVSTSFPKPHKTAQTLQTNIFLIFLNLTSSLMLRIHP